MKIGLIGLAGAGKDTVAEIIRSEFGYAVDRFAKPLKEAAEKAFGPYFDDRVIKEIQVHMDDELYRDVLYGCAGLFRLLGKEGEAEAWRLFDKHIAPLYHDGGDLSPREFQQIVGTEIVRKINPEFFVQRMQGMQGNLVCPDVRFLNELVFDLHILVVRPAAFNPHEVPPHESEHLAWKMNQRVYSGQQAAPGVYVLSNVGDLNDLRKTVLDVLPKYLAISKGC